MSFGRFNSSHDVDAYESKSSPEKGGRDCARLSGGARWEGRKESLSGRCQQNKISGHLKKKRGGTRRPGERKNWEVVSKNTGGKGGETVRHNR